MEQHTGCNREVLVTYDVQLLFLLVYISEELSMSIVSGLLQATCGKMRGTVKYSSTK